MGVLSSISWEIIFNISDSEFSGYSSMCVTFLLLVRFGNGLELGFGGRGSDEIFNKDVPRTFFLGSDKDVSQQKYVYSDSWTSEF